MQAQKVTFRFRNMYQTIRVEIQHRFKNRVQRATESSFRTVLVNPYPTNVENRVSS